MGADLDIPSFLKISAEERNAAWETFLAKRNGKYTSQHGTFHDELREKIVEQRAIEKKARSAKALAELKEKRKGQRWDRKLKMWFPIDKPAEE